MAGPWEYLRLLLKIFQPVRQTATEMRMQVQELFLMVKVCDPGSVRGVFQVAAAVQSEVHLDSRVYQYLAGKAQSKGIAVDDLVNDILKKAIEMSWRLES